MLLLEKTSIELHEEEDKDTALSHLYDMINVWILQWLYMQIIMSKLVLMP